MGTWKTYKLGDVCLLQRGHDLPHAAMSGGDIPVIGSQGIIGYHDRATLDAPCPGVTLGRSGSLGNPRYWKTPYWAHNTALYVKDFRGNNPLFMCYLLSQIDYRAFNGGGAVPTLNRNVIHQLNVSLPPLEEQERIAGILGAYDDLIAVNERRMALLEEAAHRLYRDRFVAHVDPTWDRKPLGEMAEFIHNTYRPSENWPSITYLDTGNITRNRIDTLVTAPFRDLPTSAKRKVSPGDFIYSTVRPNKLHYGLFLQVPEHFLVSTAFAVIRGKITISSSIYLYHLLIDEQMTDYLHAIGEQTSATYPTINEDDMAPITVLCPPLEIQEEFTRYVLPYHEAFDTLARENALLREGRDKLLPRLLREEV